MNPPHQILAMAVSLASGLAIAQTPVPLPQQWHPRAPTAGVVPTPDTVRTAAEKISDMRKLLADPDASVRISAFDQMAESNDLAMQEVAYEAAFASAEVSMRALALRRRLMHMANITIEYIDIVSDPKRTSRGAPGSEGYFRASSMPVVGVDEHNGVLLLSEARVQDVQDLRRITNTVSISGTTVALATENIAGSCRGALRLDDSNTLTGLLTCTHLFPGFNDPIAVKARIRVQ